MKPSEAFEKHREENKNEYENILWGPFWEKAKKWFDENTILKKEQVMKGLFFIGDVRRFLFTKKPSKWNTFVRDVTARLENGWLIRSK